MYVDGKTLWMDWILAGLDVKELTVHPISIPASFLAQGHRALLAYPKTSQRTEPLCGSGTTLFINELLHFKPYMSANNSWPLEKSVMD